MSEAKHLSEALEGLFVDPQSGWFTPIMHAIDGLTAEQAAKVPAQGFNSVWGVINHVRFWQEYVLLRLEGKEVDRAALGSEHGWPAVPNPIDEQAWAAAHDRALEVNRELAQKIAGFGSAELSQPYIPGRARRDQIIQGVIAHNSYHACEVISIRHMLGLWLDRA